MGTKNIMKQPSDLFKAFADETRVRILHLLAQGEQCVCELQATIRVSQPTISRHLAYLRRMGLVTERRQGKWMIYALAPASDAVHGSLLKCLRGCFQEVEMLKKDLSRRNKIKSPRCCG
jgi:ArsR family transcriptional regulator